ncbi:MAG: hypothetical protein ACLQVD_12600 [Capsulimonadaceae bacterium]
MARRVYPVFEHAPAAPTGAPAVENSYPPSAGTALATLLDFHPELEPLLDFCADDPIDIARAVGMIYPGEEDAEEDLAGIDFGQLEWHEATAGLAAVHHAARALQCDPDSVARVLYDPHLRPADVIADLIALENVLEIAQQHEIRFQLRISGEPELWRRIG